MEELQQQQQRDESRPKSLWHHRNFLRLWASDTISQFGGQFSGWAIPTIAAYVLGASPLEIGLLGAVGFIAWPLFALPIGAWVDQRKRRPIMVAANIGRAVALASIPLAWYLATGAIFKTSFSFNPFNIYTLYIVAFTVGLLTVFFDISYQSYLPSLVDRDQLVDGNSKLQISQSTAQVFGPSISTSAIDLITIPASPLACLGDAIGFSASAIFLKSIDKEEVIQRNTSPDRPSFASQIKEGLMVVFRDGRLRSIAAATGTSNLFSNAIFPLIFLFAKQDLLLNPAVALGSLGVAATIGGVAGLIGAFTAGRIAKRIGVGPIIILSIFVGELAALFLAYDTPALATPFYIPIPLGFASFLIPLSPFFILFFVFGSWGGVVYNVNQVSLRQAIVPLKIQGRMNASMRWLVWGTIPLGAVMGGILGQTLGLRTGITIAAFGGLLSALWVFLGPVRNLKTIPLTHPEDEPALPN